MNKKRAISLEEQKNLRYEMLVEVDKFCREHELKYSLAFGTLLGAVRHQGFIPWDDDLDIMMPLPDMLQLKKEFRSNNIKFCDIDTEPNYRCAFANFGYNATYRKGGLVSTFFGVGIDLYPLVGIPNDKKQQDFFFQGAEALQKKRSKYLKWQSRITKCLPIKTIPGYVSAIRSFRDYLYYCSVPYQDANTFYIIAGPFSLRERMIYSCDLFKDIIELPYEDGSFKCIKNYDYFLSLRYGDYMKLPPKEEQVPHHGQTYFWR